MPPTRCFQGQNDLWNAETQWDHALLNEISLFRTKKANKAFSLRQTVRICAESHAGFQVVFNLGKKAVWRASVAGRPCLVYENQNAVAVTVKA